MKFFCFVIWLAYSELFLHSGSVLFDLKSRDEYSLVVRKHSLGFDFAPASTNNDGTFSQYLSIYNNFYYLCPDKPQTHVLRIEKYLHDYYSPKNKICKYAVEPSIYKAKIYKIITHPETIYIDHYDIGFTIDYNKFNKKFSRTDYELLDEKYYFLPMISVYTFAGLKLTFAVSYHIITPDFEKKLKITTTTHESSELFPNKIQELYLNQKKKLLAILGDEYDPNEYELKLGSLVNENDFIDDIWKKTTRYKVYQILIWKNNIEIWRNIQEFARKVGTFGNSKTTITAGIGRVLTLSNSKGRKYIMRWGKGEETIFIPKLYWLAVKYYEDEETTGLVIIMHNEPKGQKNVEKICDEDQCTKKNLWIPSTGYDDLKENVYCCKLKPDILKRLGIHVIHKDFCFFKNALRYPFPSSWEEDKRENDLNDG